MKTVGRGRDYQKALRENLIQSLQKYKQITTTKRRAKILKERVGKRLGGQVTVTPLAGRRGDNSQQMRVELILPKQNEDTTNKTTRNTKKVASR